MLSSQALGYRAVRWETDRGGFSFCCGLLLLRRDIDGSCRAGADQRRQIGEARCCDTACGEELGILGLVDQDVAG